MQDENFAEIRRQAVDSGQDLLLFQPLIDGIRPGDHLKDRAAGDHPPHPGGAPDIPAAVQRHLQQPGLFAARRQTGPVDEQADEGVVAHVLRLAAVSQIKIAHADHVGGIAGVQRVKPGGEFLLRHGAACLLPHFTHNNEVSFRFVACEIKNFFAFLLYSGEKSASSGAGQGKTGSPCHFGGHGL